MEVSIVKRVSKLLRETADKLDAGNSSITESEAMHIMGILCHEAMSKAQVCQYLNINRNQLRDLIKAGVIPEGRKVVGYKELRWYKDEIDAGIRKHRENHLGTGI